MSAELQNHFVGKKALALLAVLTACIGLFVGVLCFVQNTYYFIFTPFMALVAIFMVVAYAKHQKNVMKGLMGASLLWVLSEEAGYLEQVLESNRGYYFAVHGGHWNLYVVLKAVSVAVFLGIFILHFVINSDRKSSPKTIRLNRALFFVLIALYVADGVLNLLSDSFSVGVFALILFKLCLVILVLCLETNLDEFRLIREAKGWKGQNDYSEKNL